MDAIARRYHTDPYTVLTWAAPRLGAAILGLRAGQESAMDTLTEGGQGFEGLFALVMRKLVTDG